MKPVVCSLKHFHQALYKMYLFLYVHIIFMLYDYFVYGVIVTESKVSDKYFIEIIAITI